MGSGQVNIASAGAVGFEPTVLFQLAELTTSQKYIKEAVEEIKGHLQRNDDALTDLSGKHYALRLELANASPYRNLDTRLGVLETDMAIRVNDKADSGVVWARWYHWAILITSTTLSAILSSALLRKLKLLF